jgi:hypothetical protein
MQQGRQVQRADTFQVTGDLLDGVDMAPLHRCLHIHACLGRLPQFADYYAENRRQQVRVGEWNADAGWLSDTKGGNPVYAENRRQQLCRDRVFSRRIKLCCDLSSSTVDLHHCSM